MATWWINTYVPYVYDYDKKQKTNSYGSGYGKNAPSSVNMDGVMTEKDIEEPPPPPVDANTSSNYTTVSQNQVNTTFEISIPYSIPTDNKQYSVDIQSYSMAANYRYYCAPRLDKDAFLLAKITGWDQYNLLSGDANIFYEGMYVGKSYIDTRNTADTLDISLGRDANVVVDRTKLKDLCEKKIIGLNKKETYTWEISVRNKKKQNIEIDIDDQIPVSQNKEVEVELIESSSAKYDIVTGKLSWLVKLGTGENKKMKFGYSVKYPKDKLVSNL